MKLERRQLKKDTKKALKKAYIMALAMSLLLCLAGARTYNSDNQSLNTIDVAEYTITIPADGYGLPPAVYDVCDLLGAFGFTNSVLNLFLTSLALAVFVRTALAAIVFSIAMSSLFRLFAGYHMEVGISGYFADKARGQISGLGRLKCGFGRGVYLNILVSMFLRSLYITLWGLLLIIPGIVKAYSYMLVPYILADNPALNHKRALELSRKMTDGYKMQMFIMRMSFIGWEFLGILLFSIGQALVWPYIDQTFAGLYLELRDNAIDSGFTSWEELGVVVREAPGMDDIDIYEESGD